MKYVMFCLLASFMLCLLSGCGSSSRQGNILPCPWPERHAPKELHVVADDILAFQSVIGRAPMSLQEIDESNLNSVGSFAEHAYAYHPTGIGVLSEGWRILVADDRIRKRDHLWCILRPPSRSARLSGLRVAMVPLREVYEAGRMAGRGADGDSIKIFE